jgi:trehalose synthase
VPLIHLVPRSFDDYADAIRAEVLEDLRELARPLAGLRVLHLSASPYGSTVAETLSSLVPLQRDLGLKADWYLLRGDAPRVWTTLYEGLAGSPVRWGERERQAWYAYGQRHARALEPGYDLVVVHDPQALVLAQLGAPDGKRPRWVWHCHLDTRQAQPEVWEDTLWALEPYVAAVYPSESLRRPDLSLAHSGIVRWAIDPHAPRNLPLAPEAVGEHLGRLGIDPSRPLIGQFAPIDHRYQPIAALGVYWIARLAIPGLQIVLADSSGVVTERARRDLEQVADAAAGNPDIHLLTPQDGLGPTDFNALQRGVQAVIQLAVPRGFGWGLAECQWKGKPAVVGQHGQLREQVGAEESEPSGLVIENPPGAAAAIQQLLQQPAFAATLGQRGHQRVARDHIIIDLLADHLRLIHQVCR